MRLFRRRRARADETAPLPSVEPATGPGAAAEEWVEERPPPPPAAPPPQRQLWPWLLLLLVLVLAGLGALYLVQQDDDDGDEAAPVATTTAVETEAEAPARTETATTGEAEPAAVTVPELIGLRLPAALERLESAGLAARSRGVFSREPRGVVVAQRPAAGEEVDRGARVRVNVSKGAERVAVPEVVGLREDEATTALRGAGLRARSFTVPAEDPEGTVVAQNPPGGARLARGDAVRINVSAGPEQPAGATQPPPAPPPPARVAVPEVTGVALREAQRQLRELGFVVRVFYVPSTDPPGTVVAQRPAAGTQARRGASVRVNVSRGPTAGRLVDIPDVLGLEEAEAVEELEAAGFEVEVIAEPTPSEEEQGIVIRQEPEPGERAPRGALVILYVGQFTG